MTPALYYIVCGVLSALALVGISMMSKVTTSVRGNLLLSFSLLAGFVLTVVYYDIFAVPTIYALVLVGTVIGVVLARRVKMIEMPQTVAMLNGLGGLAGAIVGGLTLVGIGITPTDYPVFVDITATLAVMVGLVTFVGSMVAAAKLHRLLPQHPVIWKSHQATLTALLIGMAVMVMASCTIDPGSDKWIHDPYGVLIIAAAWSAAFGYAFAIRVGGADMPIAISLLTSLAGVAAAIAGLAIGDLLVVAIGGIVGSSGLILTQIMCRAMNRKLMVILTGKTSAAIPAAAVEPAPVKTEGTAPAAPETPAAPAASSAPESAATPTAPELSAGEILRTARRVIIVPGYGMALAQAQHEVHKLEKLFEANGADVKYAIHPVAGRMPGHMNVLLAEADVDYERLYEMDAVNDDFKSTDVVVVVGANDVMNPAAHEAEGTPIYGMPILNVGDAKRIFICNFDLKPGYAGVPNPLYDMPEKVTMMLGDAKESLAELIKAFE